MSPCFLFVVPFSLLGKERLKREFSHSQIPCNIDWIPTFVGMDIIPLLVADS